MSKKIFVVFLGMSIFALSGCDLLPSHASDDHGHNEAEIADPNHHHINDNFSSHDDHSMNHDDHSMNHADMVRSEFDFIYLMIPHHQEAVDSSLPINSTTTNPELKTLTDAIITSQTAEIAIMKKRLTEFYPDTTYDGMGYMNMMRDVSQITDIPTKEKMRTQDMIAHHQGALDMANKLLQIMDKNDPLIKVDEKTGIFRAALRKFAQDVITNQSKEIQEMQDMLST